MDSTNDDAELSGLEHSEMAPAPLDDHGRAVDETPFAEFVQDPGSISAQPVEGSISPDRMTAEELRHRADEIIEAQFAHSNLRKFADLPPLANDFDNMAANGGAVACLILGLMAVAGVWFTPLSAINAMLAIPFAAWSSRSKMKRIGTVGFCLATVALIIVISQWWFAYSSVVKNSVISLAA